ncbi:MAG: redoxin domain-containing protein [Myxococcales bacterium]|nr:redoxin domain-containing protein [Myxococcales bacterium]
MRLVMTVLTMTALGCSATDHPPGVASDVTDTPGAPALDATPGRAPLDASNLATDGAQQSRDWSSATCAAPPAGVSVGYGIGDQLAAVKLKTCDGADVTLDDFCGANALWVFAAHGWCPHCQAVSREAESIEASFAGANVASVNVLFQSTSGAPPTAADCKAWRTAFKMDQVVTLYDPTGAMQPLWDNSYTALSVFVDRKHVIVSKSHSDSAATITTAIQAAAAH